MCVRLELADAVRFRLRSADRGRIAFSCVHHRTESQGDARLFQRCQANCSDLWGTNFVPCFSLNRSPGPTSC
eukprot:4412216-Amphidinium_carterae.1